MCGMIPLLISQSAFAHLTDRGGEAYGGPNRVAVGSTFAATLLSLIVATVATPIAPHLIPAIYGASFSGATLAVTLGIATSIVHMSGGPASSRLTIVSMRLTTVINGLWSIFIFGMGALLLSGGSAVVALSIFLAAHLFAAMLVVAALFRAHRENRDLLIMSLPGIGGAMAFAALGWLRFSSGQTGLFDGVIIVVGLMLILLTLSIARSNGTLDDWGLHNWIQFGNRRTVEVEE